jgi:hypothetical protein
MMTSGLVMILDPGSPARESTLAAIRDVPAFTVGEEIDSSWSVALEAGDGAESERWCEWLRQLPGVAGVEVVFVHWDDSKGEESHGGC